MGLFRFDSHVLFFFIMNEVDKTRNIFFRCLILFFEIVNFLLLFLIINKYSFVTVMNNQFIRIFK